MHLAGGVGVATVLRAQRQTGGLLLEGWFCVTALAVRIVLVPAVLAFLTVLVLFAASILVNLGGVLERLDAELAVADEPVRAEAPP